MDILFFMKRRNSRKIVTESIKIEIFGPIVHTGTVISLSLNLCLLIQVYLPLITFKTD